MLAYNYYFFFLNHELLNYTWEMPDSNSSGFSPFGFTIFALVLNMACV